MTFQSQIKSCPFTAMEASIGNTPAMKLQITYQGTPMTIFAKAEMYNYTGSIKDRMALNIFRSAYASGHLRPGQPIAEATSGNAGIAVAALGSALGHPVVIYMPDWMSVERQQILKSYGAQLRLVSKEEGGFLGAIAAANTLGKEEGYFLPQQFSNEANCEAHYKGTVSELWKQMQQLGETPTAFVAGVGTGGTIMGALKYLREKDADIAVHPVEPAESPTMSTGHKVGAHRMQGISDEFIPDLVKLDQLDEIIAVQDGDAIIMAQRISREFGLGVGISSGGNLLAAVKAATMQGSTGPIGTVFCDNNMKYLSTDLMREEPVKDGYLSSEIELVSIDVIPCC